MHKYHFHRAVFAVYALTSALAVLFLSAGVKSVAGLIRFPDNYLFNLIGSIVLCWLVTGPREVVILARSPDIRDKRLPSHTRTPDG